MKFWLDLILSLPRSILRIFRGFSERGLAWLIPFVVLLLVIAVVLLFVGTAQVFAPFIYSLI